MIRVYSVCLDLLEEDFFLLQYHKMPIDRQLKTDQYRHEWDKKRSVAAFYLLDYAWREYLNRHGKRDSQNLNYSYGEFGKPYLVDFPDFHFSISHSGAYAVCAVSEDGEVGVDIQKVKSAPMNLAKRFFAQSEYQKLTLLPEGVEQDKQFAMLWTMKESYLKFTGKGMQVELSSFSVEEDSGKIISRLGSTLAYSVLLEPFPGYIICVCHGNNKENFKLINLNK